MPSNSSNYLAVCESTTIWDDFLSEANEASPFMSFWFSDILNLNNEKLLYIEDGKPIAALLIYKEGKKVIQPGYSIYHSICFNTQGDEDISRRFHILEHIVAQLTEKYKEGLTFSFHPKIEDLRPLLWHNYEGSEREKFNIAIRYTAVLNLDSFDDITEFLKLIRKGRKYDYKKSLKEKISVSLGATKQEVIGLYKKTFERQAIQVDSKSISFLEKLTGSMKKETGFICTARNESGVAVGITICLIYKDTAYSLIIANDPDFRHTGAGTACVLRSVLHAKELGKNYFDFVGANSPNRGDFKLSFNAKLKKYFEATYKAI